MRIYATKRQSEMIVKAIIGTYGLSDKDALSIIKNTSQCLELQCKKKPRKGGDKK